MIGHVLSIVCLCSAFLYLLTSIISRNVKFKSEITPSILDALIVIFVTILAVSFIGLGVIEFLGIK